MSEEEVVEASEETQEAPAEPEQNQMSLADLKVGYVVGLTEDRNFVFEIFGKEKGMVEVLGLHQHASSRVESIYNKTQLSGDALTHQVGLGIKVLNDKLDQLLQVVAPKKPDNDL